MRLVCLLMFAVSSTSHCFGDNWPDWRGPELNSVVKGDYAIEWGEEKNIVWKVKVPGWGTSTPAIWEDSIFLTCADTKNLLLCLNRAGKEQWKVEFGDPPRNRNRKASAANPSPVTDGAHVFAYFKNGDVACVDMKGKKVWSVNLQEKYGRVNMNWDLGTSPVLTEKFVLFAVMHQGPSFLVALNKTDGKVAWKQDRDLGAPSESQDSYTTPLVLKKDDVETVVVLGADHVTAHNAADGKELWRAGNLNPNGRRNFRSISSPVIAGDLVLAPYARGETLTAVQMGGSGDVTKSHVKWTAERAAADVPTPIAVGDKVYCCTDRGDVHCVDIKSGDIVWSERLPRNRYVYSSSPVYVDGRIYATREDGTTFVLKVGEKPELVATNELQENTYATPAFADGKIYLRTSEYLFCIGK